jgi:hypothetical protein
MQQEFKKKIEFPHNLSYFNNFTGFEPVIFENFFYRKTFIRNLTIVTELKYTGWMELSLKKKNLNQACPDLVTLRAIIQKFNEYSIWLKKIVGRYFLNVWFIISRLWKKNSGKSCFQTYPRKMAINIQRIDFKKNWVYRFLVEI